MVDRREFIALGFAASVCGGCRCMGKNDEVRFGIVSDTHVTGDESKTELERALRFLRDRDVDAVIHCGDITDFGYIHQLEAFADVWRQTMPQSVSFIPVFGNRDFSITLRMPQAERDANFERLICSAPHKHVRKILGIDLGEGIRSCFIRGVPVVTADWGYQHGLEAYMRRHPQLRSVDTPLIYAQHPHPGGTVSGMNKPDKDPVTCWLNMFPRAVAVSGHSHLPFTDPRLFCQREFTAVGAGSYYLSGGDQQTGIREVSVLSVSASGMTHERFGLHNGFHDKKSRGFAPDSKSDKPDPGSFVFAQWNIGGFCLGQDGARGAATEQRAARFKRQIAALNADIIGLCEYAPNFKMCGKAVSDELFGDFAYASVGPRLGANGNAIISRNMPISQPQIVHFARRIQKRYLVVCEALLGGRKTVLVQTHLDLDEACRRTQLDELFRLYGSLPNVIVSADFNQSDMRELAPFAQAGFKFANGGDFGMFLTHRRRNTSFTPAIDNVLVKGFDILSVRTEDDIMFLSDHRILVCRLAPIKDASSVSDS